jgi:hypothetical protein
VRNPAETVDGDYSRIGNIAILSSEGLDQELTDPCDCGTVFLNRSGTPLYFHHCANRSTPKTSFGFPLAEVMASHTQLGGVSEQRQEQERVSLTMSTSQSAGLKHFKTTVVAKDNRAQENDLAYFKVRVIDAPKKSAKLAYSR